MNRGFVRYRSATVSATPRLVRHTVDDPRWTLADITIAILADPHVCRPWVTLPTLGRIVDLVNDLGADLILLPGDFLAARQLPALAEPADRIAPFLARLSAPLGVYAAMGNHDWRDCPVSRATQFRRNSVIEAFAAAGIALPRNERITIVHHGSQFSLVVFDSQIPHAGRPREGFHRPEIAFAGLPAGEPAILMAHEPDYFAEGDPRAFLQISGHTHGGQMNLRGWRPMTPSLHGSRYGWGHIRESGRHLIVSGGIGYSGLPLRLFQPPEITLVTVRTGR
jgi:predicted MPP superfamily phosphohydrolase